MKVAAIIPAAGAGRRMGGVRKAFMTLNGKPMLQYSLTAFLAHPAIAQVVVPLSSDDLNDPPEWLMHNRVRLVNGGAERADSVRAALAAIAADIDVVLIHDAARPLVNADLIDRVLEELAVGRSATVAVPVTDTLHQAGADNNIAATVDRTRCWRAQTPQGFPLDVLKDAFARATNASVATDEAGLVAAGGWPVRIVSGETWNLKVTTTEDVSVAEAALRERNA